MGWQDVLEKLRPLHPLPGLILEWRRITNALTKVVFPLQREKKRHSALSMDRIYPVAQTHTATGKAQTLPLPCSPGCDKCLVLLSGRVSFTEPNIQNVPRDFEIQLAAVARESPPSQNTCHVAAKKG